MEAYRRNHVPEYLIHRVREKTISWFSLQNGVFTTIPIDKDGVIRDDWAYTDKNRPVFEGPGLNPAIDKLLK